MQGIKIPCTKMTGSFEGMVQLVFSLVRLFYSSIK